MHVYYYLMIIRASTCTTTWCYSRRRKSMSNASSMDLKSKLLRALSTLSVSATITASIASAIRRATGTRGDTVPGDDSVQELLYLLTVAPSSTTFLCRRLSRLLHHSSSPRAFKCLLLLHRLLRAAHPRLELEIRDLYSSGVLRLHCPRRPSPFLLYYSRFLSERTAWAIDHSGLLRPVGPPPVPADPLHFAVWRLSRCQDFLDRVAGAGLVRPVDRVGWEALCVVLKESFRVYTSFADGLRLVLAEPTDRLHDLDLGATVLQILRRSSSQTYLLSEFYKACRGVIGGKVAMEFPDVRIVGEKDMEAAEELLGTSGGKSGWWSPEGGEDWKLETRISREWVKF